MSRRAILRLSIVLALLGPAPARADSSGQRTVNGKTIKYQIAGNQSRFVSNRANGKTEITATSGANQHKIVVEDGAITLKDKKKPVPAWKTVEILVNGADVQIKADDNLVFPDK